MAPEETRAGRVIGGRYRLVERLAAGGFGRVWRAYDESLRVEVAVKEVWLPPTLSDTERAERLARAEREARNAAALRAHPNIVPVYDLVIEDGVPWMVMRLIEGRSLAERLQQRRLSEAETREVATALLAALGAAHGAGIVHRDVKPANVMLAEGGEVLLTDFGIAVHRADRRVTESGMIIGSLEYLSPERARGEDGAAPSDLFSLGVTLYRAVEGFSPFRREPPIGALDAVKFAEAPAMKRAGDLEPLISRLLAKDPARRPTVAEARALLDPPSETLTATRDEIRPPDRPTPNRGGAALVVSALVTVGLVLLYNGHPPFTDYVDSKLGWSGTTTPSAAPTTSSTLRAGLSGENTTRRTTPATSTTRPGTTTPSTTADSRSLDRQETDRTPLTAAGLLPKTFRDSKNVEYSLRSSGVHSCLGNAEREPVRAGLRRARCSNMLAATFVDHSNKILVSVVVVPLASATAASTAYEELKGSNTADWGIWCPTSGPGSTVCQGDYNKAAQSGYIRSTHRYLIHARAMYVNLSSGTVEKPWVEAAAQKTSALAGPQ
ncbi:serine/threonine-protein kinase [Crossiella cryophila]|uniref:non-specific serine/threonine protein kinase n=1 Tax=Crossiella cryophila TaxID=43355 RepID=A0A7W7CK36_9PSEU|nr:serine/threonine-protein kinase [Crossiella cryophila]MBB4681228.1 serine/threonine protein kinase [Crossiella cryophila]